jgi:hypothetical protein
MSSQWLDPIRFNLNPSLLSKCREQTRIIWIWPKFFTLWPWALFQITSCNDQSNPLLGNHSPEIIDSTSHRTLRCDYLFITDCQRAVYKICIYVFIQVFVCSLANITRLEFDSCVLVRQDIAVSVFHRIFVSINEQFMLVFCVCDAS